MTVKELYKAMCEVLPDTLREPWDNDGLMCCPDGDREVGRVLVALDVTSEVAAYAKAEGFDVIVSHHPLLFKGLKSVNGETYLGKKTVELLLGGISVMSFHTRLDAVSGGVNDTLAALLGLSDVEPFGDEGIGRVGNLPRTESIFDFASRVKSLLGAPAVAYSDSGRTLRRVAVLGGAGGDDVAAAMAAGADTYLSGTLGYHDLTDAPESGMNLVAAGHYYTEAPVCTVLCAWLTEADPTLTCDIFRSANVAVI